MKKIIVLISVLLIGLFVSEPLTVNAQRKKVGVVLSGGGAKGVAHIGALKVLEEAGIPIDYIAGTSMGAIVGGLYAIGYDTKTLDSMVRSQNWAQLLSDRVSLQNMSINEKEAAERYVFTVALSRDNKLKLPAGLVGGQNVLNLLTELTIGYNDSTDFTKFPIPFACVAYDMVKGEDVVIDKGNLPLAIRASMSIPGAFIPVRRDGMVLVDGGISNNYPVDVAKKMGADIIIGIDVGAGARTEDELNTVTDLLDQLTTFTGEQAKSRNIAMTDLYIHPEIAPYTAASFAPAAIDTLINRGEQAARARWDQIIALKERIGIHADENLARKDVAAPHSDLWIETIKFEGLEFEPESLVRRVSGLKEHTVITLRQLHDAVSKLQGAGLFSSVNYRLDGKSPYNLTFFVKEQSQSSISIGLRFDTEEMAAILLDATYAIRGGKHTSSFRVTSRLSSNPYARTSYTLGSPTKGNLSLSYMFKYNRMNLYDRGKKLSNVDFGNHQIDLNFSNIKLHNIQINAGIRYDYYDYRSLLISSNSGDVSVPSEGLISYYASAQLETLDSYYYPTRGQALGLRASLHTDNFATYNGDSPYAAISAYYRTAISLSDRVAFLPAIYGRTLIGNNVSFPSKNLIGGTVPGRYMQQQLPFIGIGKYEIVDNTIVVARLDFRVRLWKRHYASLKANYARQSYDILNLFDGEDIWGAGIGYSYNSVIGPIELLLESSSHNKGVGFYFNLGYYF